MASLQWCLDLLPVGGGKWFLVKSQLYRPVCLAIDPKSIECICIFTGVTS